MKDGAKGRAAPRAGQRVATLKRETSARSRELLEEVLDITLRSGAAVDAISFRISHADDRELLQNLEHRSLLATTRTGRYYVPVLGLAAINNHSSGRLLQLGDKLAAELQRRLRDTELRSKPFHATEIAEHLGLPIDDCLLALLHLGEAVENWSGGRSSDWPSGGGWILPSERVLDWPSTAAFIQQLKEWRSPERQLAKSNARAALLGYPDLAVKAFSLSPAWYRDIKSRPLRTLLGEIHRARESSCPTLMVLGLRSALDTMCNLMWEDLQTFDLKLKRLLAEGMIGPKQLRLLTAAVEIGHAATHRCHIPTQREADMVSDIVEGLIKQHYSLNKRVERAAERVPKRHRTKKLTFN